MLWSQLNSGTRYLARSVSLSADVATFPHTTAQDGAGTNIIISLSCGICTASSASCEYIIYALIWVSELNQLVLYNIIPSTPPPRPAAARDPQGVPAEALSPP